MAKVSQDTKNWTRTGKRLGPGNNDVEANMVLENAYRTLMQMRAD